MVDGGRTADALRTGFMKYWRLFAHPYAFGREEMPSISSHMGLTSVAKDLLFSLTLSIILITFSMWGIGSAARLEMSPSISLFITLWITGAVIAAQAIPQAAILWGLRLIGGYKTQSFSIFLIFYGKLTILFLVVAALTVVSNVIPVMIAYHLATAQTSILVFMFISYGLFLYPFIALALFLWCVLFIAPQFLSGWLQIPHIKSLLYLAVASLGTFPYFMASPQIAKLLHSVSI
jgi:hypothetical protein